jgi:high-affinity Fe2+/Pb2+ permease
LTPELLLYSLFPLILVFNLDDISARYTIPLLVLCAFFLTVGVAGYRFSLHRDSFGLGLLILVLAAVVTWLFASHGVQNYWQMISELGYQCVPDSPGCASLAANAIPWWILFFHP